MVGENFVGNSFADTPINIPAVNPERTFLEKIFLLHEEFQKPLEKIRVDRLSRHLYDIEKIMNTPFAVNALENPKLYNSIIEHRQKITPVRGIDYKQHQHDRINFIPPDAIRKDWEKDYKIMTESMIYGSYLPFNELINKLVVLNKQINALNW